MDALAKAISVLSVSSQTDFSSNKKVDVFDKERNALNEIRFVLTTHDCWNNLRFTDIINSSLEFLFDFIAHSNTDLRLMSERILDNILRHLISESYNTRAALILLSEIKRNNAARSLSVAISRFSFVLKYVKPIQIRALSAHFISYLQSVVVRSEEIIQSALQRYIPSIFSFFIIDSPHHIKDSLCLFELALSNLGYSGPMNRAAVIIIYNLSLWQLQIEDNAFKIFSKLLALADDQQNRASLVGALNCLKLLWPTLLTRSKKEATEYQYILYDVLRCLFSSESDVIVAALEFLEQALSLPHCKYIDLRFFPQLMQSRAPLMENKSIPTTEALLNSTSPPRAPSGSSLFYGSPVISFSNIPLSLEINDSLADEPLNLQKDFDLSETQSVEWNLEGDEVLDPLRYPSCSEVGESEELVEAKNSKTNSTIQLSRGSNIPPYLPTDLCSEQFCTYTAVLLARNFLLGDQSSFLITVEDVRTSHKILALTCINHLALDSPEFFDIAISNGVTDVQRLKDLQLYITQGGDELRSLAIIFTINASRAAFRSLGKKFKEKYPMFRKTVVDMLKVKNSKGKRAILVSFKMATNFIVHLELFEEICGFACECSLENCFLLRSAVAEFIANIKWSLIYNSTNCIPDDVFSIYYRLVTDEDRRVRKIAAGNLHLLVQNANYAKNASEMLSYRLNSCFSSVNMSIGMTSHFNFWSNESNDKIAENLSFLLRKLFDNLVLSADDSQQAGLSEALFKLCMAYPPSCYPQAWMVNSTSDTSVGLILAFIAKCNACCFDLTVFVNLINILSYLFAGFYEYHIMKSIDENLTQIPSKLLDIHILDQILLLPMRVLNMYYTLICSEKDIGIGSGLSTIVPNSTLSPIRKVLPYNNSISANEQQLRSVSNLVNTNIKMMKTSSYFHSSSLVYISEAMKGAYINFSMNIEEEASERFTSLLVAALRNISCFLEMVPFIYISNVIEELLLYCRTFINIVPLDSVDLVVQLLKVLFGENCIMLPLATLMEVKLTMSTILIEDKCKVQGINNLLFHLISDPGRGEFYKSHVLRSAGWLRTGLISKSHKQTSNILSSFISLFEPFVSSAIRVYHYTGSTNAHSSILRLLCILIRGGINFKHLDPDSRLFNFILSQVNDFGSAIRILDVNVNDHIFIQSVFEFFVVVSRVEHRGQLVLEKNKILAMLKNILIIVEKQKSLCIYGLNCVRVVFLDFIAVRLRFDPALPKILQDASFLMNICPTKYIQLWSLLLYGAANFSDENVWIECSLVFFELFQKMNDGWTIDTVLNSFIALRLCSPAIFQPIDTFFNNMISILRNDIMDCRNRLLLGLPYFFIFLCVLKEANVCFRIKQLYNLSNFEIARLFANLLHDSILELRNYTLRMLDSIGKEFEDLIILFMDLLIFSINSDEMACINSLIGNGLSAEIFHLNLELMNANVFAKLTNFLEILQTKNQLSLDLIKNLNMKLSMPISTLSMNLKEICNLIESCPVGNIPMVLSQLFSSAVYPLELSEEEDLNDLFKCYISRSKSSQYRLSFLINFFELLILKDVKFNEKSFKKAIQEELVEEKFLKYFQDLVNIDGNVANEENQISCYTTKSKKSIELEESISTSLRNFISLINSNENVSNESLMNLLISIMSHEDEIISQKLFAHFLVYLDQSSCRLILKAAFAKCKFGIISTFMDEVQNMMMSATSGFSDCWKSMNDIKELLKLCIELAFDSSVNSRLQLYVQDKIARVDSGFLYEKGLLWAEDEVLFDYWFVKYAEILQPEHNINIDKNELSAICFAITRPSFIKSIENCSDLRKVIDFQMCLARNLAMLISYIHSKIFGIHRKFDASDTSSFWDINVINNSDFKDLDNDYLWITVQKTLKITLFLRESFRNNMQESSLNIALERLARAVVRLPLFGDISYLPQVVLNGTHLAELRQNSFLIQSAGDNLTHIDALCDLNWNLSWSGLNRRTNFDILSIPLFRILSKTPSGSALFVSNFAINEDIVTSAAAVDCLTTLLLQNLLYPERGNPIISKFIVREREVNTDFLGTSYGQRLQLLKGKLTNISCGIPIYCSNLEFLFDNGHKYRSGIMSIHTLWKLTGIIDKERKLYENLNLESSREEETLKSSKSNYIIDSSHDLSTESCLRTLFDTFSHWFRTGIDALPVTLLSSVIRSMALLSDLFTDLDQYKFVFTHLKTLFNARYGIEHHDLGYVIYGLLKCIAVLGLEYLSTSKADFNKVIFTWIETGLKSNLSEIRSFTLQGILLVAQAVNCDDIRMVLSYIVQFITGELALQRPEVDSVNMSVSMETQEYICLIWTAGFFFCENQLLSSEDFTISFIEFMGHLFTSLLTPDWMMELLTCGVERLVINSRNFIPSFNRIAFQVLDNYFSMPNKFVFSLRIILACLYRGIQEGNITRIGLEPYDPCLQLMEKHGVIFKILSEGWMEDSEKLMDVLPHLLTDSLNQSEVINSILKELIHRYSSNAYPRPVFIFNIIHHWFSILRSRETDSIVLDWTLNGLHSFKYVTDHVLFRYYVSCFLSSSSTNSLVSSLFHLIVGCKREELWLLNYWFNLTVSSFIEKIDPKMKVKLKSIMEIYIKDGKELRDPRRVENFPQF